MRIYLDDNITDARLADMLRKAGHEVIVPAEVGTSGIADARHLIFAIAQGVVILTHDHTDFNNLHELVLASGGTHPGILVVRRDNDTTRDLTPRGIVTAIMKLEAARMTVANERHILNLWR